MSNKTLLCISNEQTFLLFCQATFMNNFELLYASHAQLDLYYAKIPHFAGILISDKDVSPEQMERTFAFLQRAPEELVFICTEKLDNPENQVHNVVLIDDNFKNNILSKLEVGQNASRLVGDREPQEKKSGYFSKTFKEKIGLACKCDSLVLLVGETGSGKSFAARYIHNNSSRKEKPFTEETLSNINPGLIESTLFGTTKGSFTNAENKIGLLEAAKDGTLFLDEVGDLYLASQGKFLRFLDTRTFRRMGSQKEIICPARIIFATSMDLAARIKAGLFREDLFHRISVLVIKIPPLRERKDEIRPLAVQFATTFDKKLSDEAVEKLEAYSWPGNIRELKSCIERSSVQASSEILSGSDIVFTGDCF